jgi:putative DNA primase/helicase
MNHRVTLYPDNVPPELKAIPQWVCYRRVPKEKDPTKTDKKPIDPKSGKYAAVNNPKTWGTFEQAVAKYNEDSSISGIGIVLTPHLGIVGIDFDDCLSDDGTFLWGADEVKNLNTYTEQSPSDTGIRMFAFGTLPPSGRHEGNIEIYNSGRFLTVTGNVVGTYRTIEDRHKKIKDFHKKIFAKKAKKRADAADSKTPPPLNLTDEQIIQKAKKAKIYLIASMPEIIQITHLHRKVIRRFAISLLFGQDVMPR